MILIYSMEKVGSSTIKNACEEGGHIVGRGFVRNTPDLVFDDYSYFISMVRDPVARNLSAYWEFRDDYPQETFPSIDDFLQLFPHEEPENWFDSWIDPMLNMDIMELPFNKELGWQIYDDLLVIRTENLTFQLSTALAVFLKQPATDLKISLRGDGAHKFGPEYTDFLTRARFEDEFLDRMYDTEYAKHFYTEYEISSMKKRWRKS